MRKFADQYDQLMDTFLNLVRKFFQVNFVTTNPSLKEAVIAILNDPEIHEMYPSHRDKIIFITDFDPLDPIDQIAKNKQKSPESIQDDRVPSAPKVKDEGSDWEEGSGGADGPAWEEEVKSPPSKKETPALSAPPEEESYDHAAHFWSLNLSEGDASIDDLRKLSDEELNKVVKDSKSILGDKLYKKLLKDLAKSNDKAKTLASALVPALFASESSTDEEEQSSSAPSSGGPSKEEIVDKVYDLIHQGAPVSDFRALARELGVEGVEKSNRNTVRKKIFEAFDINDSSMLDFWKNQSLRCKIFKHIDGWFIQTEQRFSF